MEGQIDAANNFLKTDEGKKVAQSFGENNPTGDPQTESPSFDAQGNQGAPGQFAPKEQYGAVTGGGLGGALGGQDQPPPPQQQDKGNYEGYDQNDSTAEGGWGKNAGGGAFSRSNQLGADNNQSQDEHDHHDHDHDNEGGYKTGYSTPGYRKENDDDEEEKARQQNRNVYGQQSDDRGSTGNDLNEAEI